MSSDRDKLYLTHIDETIDLIKTTMPGTVDALAADPNLRDATCR